MWPQNRNSAAGMTVFIVAVMAAMVVHALVFLFIIFTLPGTPQNYKIDFTFWGGVLRKSDVEPRGHIVAAMELKHFFSMPQIKEDQYHVWSLAVANEKPLSKETRSPDISIPEKFIGTRMLLTEEKDAGSEKNDKPLDGAHIPLRLPW